MKTVIITRVHSGFRNVADSFYVGSYPQADPGDQRATVAEFELPDGYVVCESAMGGVEIYPVSGDHPDYFAYIYEGPDGEPWIDGKRLRLVDVTA